MGGRLDLGRPYLFSCIFLPLLAFNCLLAPTSCLCTPQRPPRFVHEYVHAGRLVHTHRPLIAHHLGLTGLRKAALCRWTWVPCWGARSTGGHSRSDSRACCRRSKLPGAGCFCLWTKCTCWVRDMFGDTGPEDVCVCVWMDGCVRMCGGVWMCVCVWMDVCLCMRICNVFCLLFFISYLCILF